MSDWINKSAEKFQEEKEREMRRRSLITYSNYWLALRQQIERDVEAINSQAAWQTILGAAPVKVSDEAGGYKIEKNVLPAVMIYVENSGDAVKLKTKVIERGGTFEKPKVSKNITESLKVDSDDEDIFLVGRDDTYIVPEQASRYILSPIIEVLKRV